jgi:hypothetical protein
MARSEMSGVRLMCRAKELQSLSAQRNPEFLAEITQKLT